jgi:hypothetical protein
LRRLPATANDTARAVELVASKALDRTFNTGHADAVAAFDADFLQELADHGVVPDASGALVLVSGHQGPQPQLSREQVRYLNESRSRKQGEIRGKQQHQWIENFCEVAHVLNKEGETAPWPFFGTFWIRLHGLVAELIPPFERILRDAGVPATHKPDTGSALEYLMAMLVPMQAVRDAYTEDERIYADYMRHTHAHPTQKSYDVRYSIKAGIVVDKHGVPATGKEYSVADLDAAIDRVFRSYPSEEAGAVAFARKAQTQIAALAKTAEGFRP